MRTHIPPGMTALQWANWTLLASQRMNFRAKTYAYRAEIAPIEKWLPWAMRSIRAGKACERLREISRRALLQAIEPTPLKTPKWTPSIAAVRQAAGRFAC